MTDDDLKVFDSRKLSKREQQQALGLLKDFHQRNLEIERINNELRKEGEPLIKPFSGAHLIRQMEAEGINYSKGNIYLDIRRHGAYYKAKTPEAEQRAQDWFDNYFEPFRKSKGLTAKEAYELWIAAKTQSYENLTSAELEFALELREIGSP